MITYIVIAVVLFLLFGGFSWNANTFSEIINTKIFKTKAYWVILLCFFSLVFMLTNGKDTEVAKETTCTSDYKKCKDNADMANNYSEWFDAQYACKEKFGELVKYGTPEYKLGDSYAFSSFLGGDDYPQKGIATLIAKVAVPNEFGTKVNGEQICVFNLDTKRVIKQYGDFNTVNGFFESEDYDAIIKSREQRVVTNEKLSGDVTNTNGNKYIGELKDGKEDGQGTLIAANGKDKYVGKFKDGKMDGKGTLYYANGDKYVGEFMDGKMNGRGVFTQTNGNMYVGEFKDNSLNGQGTMTGADGKKFTGEFKDGKFIGK